MLYSKTLKISQESLASVTEGRVLNAATADLVVLDYGQYYISHMFYDPLATPVFFIMLYLLLGWEVILGFALPLLLIIFSPTCGYCTNALREKAAAATDERLKAMVDILEGI